MRGRLRSVGILALALSLGFLAACGGDEEPMTASDEGEHMEEEEEHGGGGAVHVILEEWSVSGMEGMPLEAEAGEVAFEAHNEGTVPHEMVIVLSDKDPGSLPVAGGVVDEDQVEVIGEIEEFDAGSIETGSFQLEAGGYIVFCNIAGHYEQGMYADMTVA